MFRITTLNVNGIRSATRKGLTQWLEQSKPDVACLQEVKAAECDIPAESRPHGMRAWYHCATRRGYAGTALLTAKRPREVRLGLGSKEFDTEGRYIEAQFSTVTVISVYFPSGSSGPHRQESKYRFLAKFLPHLRRLVASGREFILCGDINIAHREIDLKNWRSNQKHSGFLPEERAWLSRVFEQHGWVDVFRALDPHPERYTWWSNFGQAYAKNVGWRIDYQIATSGIAKRARTAEIFMDRRFSDHAPLTIGYTGRL